MLVYSGRLKDATEAVYMEEVTAVEEDVVEIMIAPTTPGTVLVFDIFLVISAVPIGILFRESVENILAINAVVKRLSPDVVTIVHTGTWPGWRMTYFRN